MSSHTEYNSIGRAKEGSTDVWITPLYVVEFAQNRWNEGNPFDLDAAADADNKQAPVFIGEDTDALSVDWAEHYIEAIIDDPSFTDLNCENVWLNPPYGRQMPKFLQKAYEEVQAGSVDRVVCLIACRTDTKVFHDLIFSNASEVWFIKGRLSFSGKGSANFASCFVVFDKRRENNSIAINYGPVKEEIE